MNEIARLTDIDFAYVFIAVFSILAGFKAGISLIEWIVKKTGLETKWMRKSRKEHEVLVQTSQGLKTLQKQHDESVKQSETIRSELSQLTRTINGIADTLSNMQQKENETKLKELKDSLVRYYNKYKDTGRWSKLEKDAFWDLFDDYEKRGGNGFIHSIVEPVMRELHETD